MSNDDIEADLAAGTTQLLCDPKLALWRAREIGRHVNYGDEAVWVNGDCFSLCHGSSPASLAEWTNRRRSEVRPIASHLALAEVPFRCQVWRQFISAGEYANPAIVLTANFPQLLPTIFQAAAQHHC